MEAPVVDRVGQTIAGRYRLLRRVGEGGVGTVYEAEQSLGSSSRAVAIKLLRPEWSNDASVKARFHREAALVARLQHPNTVRIYDFGTTEDGALFIAMEFLRGRPLQELLDEQGAQPPSRVLRILGQVAASLQEAHDLGIVHRDLKPDNILLLDSPVAEIDSVKLLDFGIAKGQPAASTAVTKLTALGTFVGTPAYMSPEQFGGAGVGPESDVYALGVTCYQMLAGRLPFDAETAVQWAQAHLGKPAPALAADYGAGPIPGAMRRAVARALAKDPEQRQASAARFASELADALADVSLADTAAQPSLPPAAPARHTAPMTRVPEIPELAQRSGGVAPTLPDAAPAAVPAAPRPASAAPGASRGRALGLVSLTGLAAISLTLFFWYGERLGVWPAAGTPQAEPVGTPGAPPSSLAQPAPVVIEPDPPAAPASSPAPASPPAAPAATTARAPAPARPPATTSAPSPAGPAWAK